MAAGNTGDTIISQTSFYGGFGTDGKIGIKNSYGDSECMDGRKNPSRLSVLPGARNLGDGDIRGLIVNMTQTPDGVRWGVDRFGTLYRIDVNNDVTVAAFLPGWTSGTFGDLTYWRLKDAIYITGNDRIYAYTNATSPNQSFIDTITGKASSYPTVAQILVKDRDGKWIGGGTNRWSSINGQAQSDGLPTSIIENEENTCIFLPDQSPMTRISVRFHAKGSGQVHLVVHDAQNKEIAHATKNASEVQTGQITYFDFPETKVGDYANFGTEYHIHMYASDGNWRVETYEQDKMYGLHFQYFASLLTSTTRKSHPIINWGGSKLFIGNDQYLVDWLPSGLTQVDETEFNRHRVIVENGMEVTTLTSNDEYVVLGCEKVSTVPGRSFQEGMLGFWDGFADGLNFKIDTPMGEPKSLFTYQNITYTIIDGAMYAYTGAKQLTKVRTLNDSHSEYSERRDTTDIYPHCMTVRRGIMLFAFPSKTSLYTMRHGIYSWGAVDKNYPESFYYSYNMPEASGNYNTSDVTYELGGCWNFGDTLYFSYQIQTNNDTRYNLAVVDNNSKPAKKFSYQSLMYDGGVPWADKQALRMGVTFRALPKGATIIPKYKIDAKPWVYGKKTATEGDVSVRMEINKRFKEITFGFDGTTTDATPEPPTIVSVQLNARTLGEEMKL